MRSSTFKDPQLYIVDIFIAIDRIERYTAHIPGAQALLHDEMAWDATLKELENIGEAVKMLLKHRLLDDEYKKVVDFRNIIAHAYFGIDEEQVWYVVRNKLAELKRDLLKLARAVGIDEAIDAAMVEYRHFPKTLQALRQLKKDTDAF